MARAMQLIGFAAAASADTGPSARQLRGYAANATSLAQAQTCSTKGNYCQPSIDGKPPISCCGELACKQIIQLPAASPATVLAQHPGWRLREGRTGNRDV